MKDRLNELYAVTGIKLSYFNFEMSFWMLIKPRLTGTKHFIIHDHKYVCFIKTSQTHYPLIPSHILDLIPLNPLLPLPIPHNPHQTLQKMRQWATHRQW